MYRDCDSTYRNWRLEIDQVENDDNPRFGEWYAMACNPFIKGETSIIRYERKKKVVEARIKHLIDDIENGTITLAQAIKGND